MPDGAVALDQAALDAPGTGTRSSGRASGRRSPGLPGPSSTAMISRRAEVVSRPVVQLAPVLLAWSEIEPSPPRRTPAAAASQRPPGTFRPSPRVTGRAPPRPPASPLRRALAPRRSRRTALARRYGCRRPRRAPSPAAGCRAGTSAAGRQRPGNEQSDDFLPFCTAARARASSSSQTTRSVSAACASTVFWDKASFLVILQRQSRTNRGELRLINSYRAIALQP